jgi:hypothetical protein
MKSKKPTHLLGAKLITQWLISPVVLSMAHSKLLMSHVSSLNNDCLQATSLVDNARCPWDQAVFHIKKEIQIKIIISPAGFSRPPDILLK